MNLSPDILSKLVAAMSEANTRLDAATREESAARSVACNARNEVNRLQGEIDKVFLAELKKTAPRDTDWKTARSFAVPS